MSFVDAFSPDFVLGPDQVLPTVPRNFGERFDLNWKAARAPDRWFFNESRLSELWDDALEKLHKATGQTFPNPYRLAPGKQPRTGLFGEAIPEALLKRNTPRRDDVLPDILAAFDQARAGQFDVPDPRLFEDRIREEALKLRRDAEMSALASYGLGGLGAFFGAAAGEMSHPVQAASLFVGAPYAAGNIARLGIAAYIARAAAIEGGIGMAAQAATEAMDAPIQAALATDVPGAGNDPGDRLERILLAGAGGAIFGVGLSGLVAAARGLRRRVEPRLEEADALKVAERTVHGETRNPLGPDGVNAHGDALRRAEADVSAGRHAEVREIVEQEVRRQVRSHPADEQLPRILADIEHNRGGIRFEHPDGRRALLSPDLDEPGKYRISFFTKGGNPSTHWTYAVNAETLTDRLAYGVADIERRGFRQTSPHAAVNAPEPVAPSEPKHRDALFAIRDAEDLGEEVTAKWLASATGTSAREAEKIIARLQKDGVLGEADAAGAFPVDIARLNSMLLPEPAGTTPVFDILDPTPARVIAESAPTPPEGKVAREVAEAQLFDAQQRIAADPEAKVAVGVNDEGRTVYRKASDVLAEAEEEVKAANRVRNCAVGSSI